jgi:hypothetical protein
MLAGLVRVLDYRIEVLAACIAGARAPAGNKVAVLVACIAGARAPVGNKVAVLVACIAGARAPAGSMVAVLVACIAGARAPGLANMVPLQVLPLLTEKTSRLLHPRLAPLDLTHGL